MRKINYIVVHCTAGAQNEKLSDLLAWFRKLGWKNNGYHIWIDGNGVRHDITPLEEIANGVAGHNANSIHVSYAGGIDKNGKPIDNRTELQKSMLVSVLKELKQKFPKANILGHRDFSPDKNKNGKIDKWEFIKNCPCFDAIAEYSNI